MCCKLLFVILSSVPGGAAFAADAVNALNTFRIAAETIPPGETVELKFYLGAAQPVSSGMLAVDLDPTFFGEATSATAFSGAGDAYGYAILAGRHIEIHFASASASIGIVNGLPIATVTVPVLPEVAPGSMASVKADPGGAPWRRSNQREAAMVMTDPGTVTAGGRLSIRSAEPSSGVVPAGGVLHILGSGFDSSSRVSMDGVVVSSALIAGPGEIDITVGAPTEVTGRRIRLSAPGNNAVEFFPAFQSAAVATASGDPFAKAHPILPLKSRRSATTAGLSRVSGWVVAQNPNSVPAEVSLRPDYRISGEETIVSIPPGEWAAIASGVSGGGGTLHLVSSVPVRSVGLWVQRSVGSAIVGTFFAPLDELSIPPLRVSAGPDALSWIWKTGSPKPPPQIRTLALVGLEDSNASFTVLVAAESGNWLLATPLNGTIDASAKTPATITVSADPTSLAPGIYRGFVTITPASAYRDVAPVSIGVVLTVTDTEPPAQNVLACCYEFASPSAVPLSVSYRVTAEIIPQTFTVKSLTDGGGNWLSVNPASGTSPGTVTVSANPAGVPPGQYSGEVLVTGSGSTIYMPISLRIYGGVQIDAPPNLLQFYASPGTTVPPPQLVEISARCVEIGCPPAGSPPIALSWTASVKTGSGGNWLEAAPLNGRLSVRANATGLAPGVYTGAITLAASEAAGVTQIPVVLVVPQPGAVPALTATKSSLTFPFELGYRDQSTCVLAGQSDVPLRISTSTASGGGWLMAVAPSSLFLCVVDVAVKMDGLAPGTYSGNVAISAAGQSLDIPVLLVIPQPGSPPAMGSIVNAASAIEGSISAGEMVTIGGDASDFGSRAAQFFSMGYPRRCYLPPADGQP